MGYFERSPRTGSNKAVQRLERLTWILIYGGLLALILGWWVVPADENTGWLLLAGGGLAAAIGFFLIYVRSRVKADS